MWCIGVWCIGVWCIGVWCIGVWCVGVWCVGVWCGIEGADALGTPGQRQGQCARRRQPAGVVGGPPAPEAGHRKTVHRLLPDPVDGGAAGTLLLQIVEQFGHHRRGVEHRVVAGITPLEDHQQAFVAGQQRIEEYATIVGARQPVAEPRRLREQIEFAARRGPRPGPFFHAEQHDHPPGNATQPAQRADRDRRARQGGLGRALEGLAQRLFEARGIEQNRGLMDTALAQPGQCVMQPLQTVAPGVVASQKLAGQPAGQFAPFRHRLRQADGGIETIERLVNPQPVQQGLTRTGAHARHRHLVGHAFGRSAKGRAEQQPVERRAPGMFGRPALGRHAPARTGGIEQLEQSGDLVVVHFQRVHQYRVVQPARQRRQRHTPTRQCPQVHHRAQQRIGGGTTAGDRHRDGPPGRRRREHRLQRRQRGIEVGAADRDLVRPQVGDLVEALEQRIVKDLGRTDQPMSGVDLQAAIRARAAGPGRIAGQEHTELQRLQAAGRRGRLGTGIGERMGLLAQGFVDGHTAPLGQVHDLHAEIALRTAPVSQHRRLAVVQPGFVGPAQHDLGPGARRDHVVPELAAGVGREHVHVDGMGQHPEQRELFGRHRHGTEQQHPAALQAPGHSQRFGTQGREQPIVRMDRRDAGQAGQQRVPEPALPALVRGQRDIAARPLPGLPAGQPVTPIGQVAIEVGRDVAGQLEAVGQRRPG